MQQKGIDQKMPQNQKEIGQTETKITKGPLDQHLYKNRLQEYAQKSGLPFPEYRTTNEGFQHAPKFRAYVLVNGKTYVSGGTFPHRKEAEQDAAKTALEHITEMVKNAGVSIIQLDPTHCKLILNEYAVKMNLDRPMYTTTLQEGIRPTFVSSLVFNREVYTGEVGGSKKMAEQLAARAAIRSLLESGSEEISQIINSKVKIHDSVFKVKDSGFDRSNLPIKSDITTESYGKAVDVLPSTAEMKSVVPSANSTGEKKRIHETENSPQKKLRVHGSF